MMGHLSSYVFYFVLGTLMVVFSSYQAKPPTPNATTPTLLPPAQLKYFALGYNEIVADSLWLRTIQDFDYCERRSRDVNAGVDYTCQRGWVFHMIDAVTELAPRFRQVYVSGAVMLTVLVNDIDGASVIFDKGVAQFPDDSTILYNAAYQAMIEEKNSSKASKLLIEAGKHGAPPWVFALAARLHQKSGQLELARSILKDAVELNPQGAGAERIKQRLADVEAELAKQPK